MVTHVSGAKRHFVPAALIGRFSSETSLPIRNRKVCVLRRGIPHTFQRAAGNVACKRNLYADSKFDLDGHVSAPEKKVWAALAHLDPRADGTCHADSWITVAWFVATLFARSPDFRDDMDARISAMFGETPLIKEVISSQNEMIRVIELQRLSGAVLRARWELVVSLEQSFITNDLGMSFLWHSGWNSGAYLVPLDRRHAVIVGGGRFGKLINWTDDQWRIEIPQAIVDVPKVNSFNWASWAIARNEAYGPTIEMMDAIRAVAGDSPDQPDLNFMRDFRAGRFLGSSSSERREDEMLLYQVIGGIRKPSDPASPDILTV